MLSARIAMHRSGAIGLPSCGAPHMVQLIDRHQPCDLWLPVGILVKKDPFRHQHIAGAGGGGDVQCAECAVRERQPGDAAAVAQPVAVGRDSSVNGESTAAAAAFELATSSYFAKDRSTSFAPRTGCKA